MARNLYVAIAPQHWTGPEPGGDLRAQIIADSIRPERDEQGAETGWVTAQALRYFDGEPGPTHASVRIRASVLPELES